MRAGCASRSTRIVGDLDLHSEKLITGLCVVTKRIDTGSPWILANNPRAPYWEDGKDWDGNKRYKLGTLVRASTAAPHFFDPEILPITGQPGQPAAAPPRRRTRPFPFRYLAALLERFGRGGSRCWIPKRTACSSTAA